MSQEAQLATLASHGALNDRYYCIRCEEKINTPVNTLLHKGGCAGGGHDGNQAGLTRPKSQRQETTEAQKRKPLWSDFHVRVPKHRIFHHLHCCRHSNTPLLLLKNTRDAGILCGRWCAPVLHWPEVKTVSTPRAFLETLWHKGGITLKYHIAVLLW